MSDSFRLFFADLFKQAFDYMNPYLSNYRTFSDALNAEIKTKPGENIQYGFDVTLDQLFEEVIARHGITGKVFSEERGWFRQDEGDYVVIYDPFCNSTLASLGIHDAAAGLTIFSQDHQLIASAILDYQTGVVAICEQGKTTFFQVQDGTATTFPRKDPLTLEDAWIALAFEKSKDRVGIEGAISLLTRSKRVSVGSGHSYWLRLAAGIIDGYADPFAGESLYEMFACAVAQGNGCIVTDRQGVPFNATVQLERFFADGDSLYFPVAAKNRSLHDLLLTELGSQ